MIVAYKSLSEYHATRIFKEMYLRGMVSDAACLMLFRVYIRNFSSIDARELLDYVKEQVKDANLVPYYNLAIQGFASAGLGTEASKLYEDFKNLNLHPDEGTPWAIFALWCSSAKNTNNLVSWVKEHNVAQNHPHAHRYFNFVLTELYRRRRGKQAVEIFRYMVSHKVSLSRTTFTVMAKVLCYLKDEKKIDGLLYLMQNQNIKLTMNIYNEIFFMYTKKRGCEEKFLRLFDEVLSCGLLPDIDTLSNLVVLKSQSSIEDARIVTATYGIDDPEKAYVVANQGTSKLKPHGAMDRILNLLLKIYMSTQEYDKAWAIYDLLRIYRNKNTYLWLIKLYSASGKMGEITTLLDEMVAQSITLENAHYQQILTELVKAGELISAFTLYSQIKRTISDFRLSQAFQPLVEAASEDNLRMIYELLLKSPHPKETVELLVSLFVQLQGDLQTLMRVLRRAGVTPSAHASKQMIDELLRRGDIALAAEINDRLIS